VKSASDTSPSSLFIFTIVRWEYTQDAWGAVIIGFFSFAQLFFNEENIFFEDYFFFLVLKGFLCKLKVIYYNNKNKGFIYTFKNKEESIICKYPKIVIYEA
jgi:hypothetical protein